MPEASASRRSRIDGAAIDGVERRPGETRARPAQDSVGLPKLAGLARQSLQVLPLIHARAPTDRGEDIF